MLVSHQTNDPSAMMQQGFFSPPQQSHPHVHHHHPHQHQLHPQHQQHPQQQHQQSRLANPTQYHMQQQKPQQLPQHQQGTIDPSLLAVPVGYGQNPMKAEQEQIDAGEFMMQNDFDMTGGGGGMGGGGGGGGIPVGTGATGNGSLDPTSMMSPLSSSPLDDFEVVHEDYSGRGTGSLHNSPYGTPGIHMPGNFYSMSMPVHPTAGFGAIDQTKLMGSQPSSFGAYGSNNMGFDNLDEDGKQQLEMLNEKRRRRRESHNAVERRRRDNINEKIQELATLLPEFQADAQNKPNKGVILRRSVEYIRQMQQFAERQVERNAELEEAVRRCLGQLGMDEGVLGLSVPLGTPVELPSVQPLGPGEGHVEVDEWEQGRG
ncbi:hypothetical protein HDV00_001877 [Rhizophlyctis rosea]|nr:hypothetical protein HDV00_001877 [Rhizophlyctis rosea]